MQLCSTVRVLAADGSKGLTRHLGGLLHRSGYAQETAGDFLQPAVYGGRHRRCCRPGSQLVDFCTVSTAMSNDIIGMKHHPFPYLSLMAVCAYARGAVMMSRNSDFVHKVGIML
jgi:hypothetical protein